LNTRRNLIRSIIALLVLIPVFFLGAYLIRQNYKRHHYITGTRQFGRYRGQRYRFTEEQQDKINEEANKITQQEIHAANKLREAHRR
jgi:hypothetical protein